MSDSAENDVCDGCQQRPCVCTTVVLPSAENDVPMFRHCRWFDPHPPVPVPGSEQPVSATGGRLGAVCATCGEALTSDVIPPGTGNADAAQ